MRHVNASERQSLASALESSRTETTKHQAQLNSGLRVTKASDDPSAFASASRLRSDLADIEADKKQLQSSQAMLRSHDQALGDLTSTARQMKTLVLRAANEGATQQLYDSIADEVDALLEQSVSAANTQVGKAYLFSGSQKLTKPFEVQRNGDQITGVTYRGDSAPPALGLPGERAMPLALNGRDVIAGGGEDFFTTAVELRDALRAGSIDSDQFIDRMGKIEENFVSRRAEAGAAGSYLEEMNLRLGDQKLALQSTLSDLVGADPASTAANYFASENQTQVNLAMIGRRDRLNLIDYLR